MAWLTKQQLWILSEGICPKCRQAEVALIEPALWRCISSSCKEQYRSEKRTAKDNKQ